MCSLSRQDIMDSDQAAGDLTDVVRAKASSGPNIVSLSSMSATEWLGEFVSISHDNNIATVRDDFGDPFSDMGDPLLCDGTRLAAAAHHDGSKSTAFGLPFVDEEENGHNNNGRIGPTSSRARVFSHLLQTATCERSPLVAAEGVPPLGGIKCNGEYNYVNGPVLLASSVPVDRAAVGMMQISSPRNPGMKRRKSEAKKVVCIPAAANSRPSSGEVVPSDLWAWRKYGQKPIKGSPYPRGYYRCSSSKGCSARKQVERSRTDPNMLVITYTSEHNHPWPTQRNSLAGSTRSTSKAGTISEKSGNSNNSHPAKPKVAKGEEQTGNFSKGEEQTGNSSDDNASSTAAVAGVSSGAASSVKEEMEEEAEEKQFDMEDVEFVADGLAHCYRPTMVDGSDRRQDDFFADLGELDSDPYELLFDQGLTRNYRNQGNKSLDAFDLLDWADEDDGTSFGEAIKKGL